MQATMEERAARVYPDGAVEVARRCSGRHRKRARRRALVVAVLLALPLGAWCLVPAVLQSSCSRDTMEGRSRGAVDGPPCPDDGVLKEGRDHVVCVYPDRVVKVVRRCSCSSGACGAQL